MPFLSVWRNLDDQRISGRPKSIDLKTVLQAIQANQESRTRRKSGNLAIWQSNLIYHLQAFGKRIWIHRIVPWMAKILQKFLLTVHFGRPCSSETNLVVCVEECPRSVKAMDCRIVVNDFVLQSCYYGKYTWERYDPAYPPRYGLNSTTTVFLGNARRVFATALHPNPPFLFTLLRFIERTTNILPKCITRSSLLSLYSFDWILRWLI